MIPTHPHATARPTRARAAARPIIGIGRVILRNDGSLWIGRQTGLARKHAHHAIQIALAMHGRFLMDDDQGTVWREHAGAIVMPHRRPISTDAAATWQRASSSPRPRTAARWSRATLQQPSPRSRLGY